MVPESKNTTGVTFPWERQAMNGEELPSGLDYPDQVLYLCLRSLYDHVRRGIITRDIAIVEKKKLLDEYRVYKYREKMGDEWAQIIKDTESARAEYRKNPSVENGMNLVLIIEGRKLHERIPQSL